MRNTEFFQQLEQFFGVKGTKVLGFGKSGLAQSIYAEVKQFRLNTPARPVQRAELGGPGAAKAGQSASKDCEGGGSRSDGD